MKQDIPTWQFAVQITRPPTVCAESWVIPSLALAAGPRPTWPPGMLTGNLDSAG
jgi:hypothetical protein